MKPGRSHKFLLAGAIIISLLSLLACAGLALYSIATAHPHINPSSTLLPTALSLFPVVGLVAAVAFTQLLKCRRVLQLKAIGVDRG